MVEIPPEIMQSLWALVLVVITAIIAYIEKMKKDEIIAFMDPTDTTTLSAPEGLPAVTYTMGTAEKARILAGKTPAETKAILTQIETAEAEKLAAYTITFPGGSYEIEYGYVKSSTEPQVFEPGSEVGTFDPKENPAEASGLDAKGNWVRGLKMPEERFANMVHGHTSEDRAAMRTQVDQAEKAGLRNYKVAFNGGYYLIENGIVSGGSGAPLK